MRRWVLLPALAALLLMPSTAAAVHSKLQVEPPPPFSHDVRVSADGLTLWFEHDAQFVTEDTDDNVDVYKFSGGTFQLLSGGTSNNGSWDANLEAVSDDGSRVIFETRENLSAADNDLFPSWDVYEGTGGPSTLLSVGPAGGSGSVDAVFMGASADASRVFFRSWEHLIAGDEDTCFPAQPEERPCYDLYERAGGTTTLLTPGTSLDMSYLDTSADGTHVFFDTQESLDAEDSDGAELDIYERFGGSTTLVSTSALHPNQPLTATFNDVSDDGGRVFFRTQEQLTADDTDGGLDIFERAAGQTTRVSRGSLNDNTGAHAKFMGITRDGVHVYFDTPEQLEPDDTDAQGGDLYVRMASQTELVSEGPVSVPSEFEAVSADGERVVFSTVGQFAPDDTDQRVDLYESFEGAIKRLTEGNRNLLQDGVEFLFASSPDATRILWYSREPVFASDNDSNAFDLFESWNGRVYQLSAGPAPPSCNTTCHAGFLGASRDASYVFFLSPPLRPGDPVPANYQLSVDGTYPRPRGATPLLTRLVPAFEQCTAANRTHGPPLAFGSCNPPTQTSSELTVGTPDANAQPAKSEASLRVDAIAGAPATPADEADVQLTLSITDVRRADNLADYTGAVHPRLALRVTDRNNTPAPAGLDQATGMDSEVSFDVSCAATADTTVGSTCAATTSLEAVVPGAVTEGKRSIWELGQARVDDAGGAPFMVQGLFVP